VTGPKNIQVDTIKPITEVENHLKTAPVIDVPSVQAVKPEVKMPEEKEKRFSKKHKRIFAGIVFSLILLFLASVVAAGAFAQQELYKNKVFPGVVVWGVPVGGKTVEQVEDVVVEKIKNYRINLDGPDQDYSATADDLGIIFNPESIALSAYSKGRSSSFWNNYLQRARLLVLKIKWEPLQKIARKGDLDLPISFSLDEEKFNKYLEDGAANINIKPQDSQVTIEGSNINIVPAVYGREVNKDELKNQVLGDLSALKAKKIMIKTAEIKPNVVDKAAEEVRIQSQNVISRPVILNYNGQEYRPNKETVASWISYTKTEGAASYNLVIDINKMGNYITYLESKINVYPVNKKVRVENGVKETVTQEGKDGTLVDKALLGRQIAQLLPVVSEVKLTIPTYVAKFKTETEQVIVADWEKYIDINISTQTMTAYLKGGQVVGSWAVTTGNRYHPTPVGTWLVIGKSAVTRMTGGTPGVDYYDLPNVHWVTWFKGGGYSIHEAYWRSSFGGQDYTWNGSHGCVNSPYDVANFIYNWAPVGTPVIVHY
jgi:lipoprotein-anchoring transpeptidase ErfK/SrfK